MLVVAAILFCFSAIAVANAVPSINLVADAAVQLFVVPSNVVLYAFTAAVSVDVHASAAIAFEISVIIAPIVGSHAELVSVLLLYVGAVAIPTSVTVPAVPVVATTLPAALGLVDESNV